MSFRKRTLNELWAFDWDDKYCRKEDLGEPGEECELNFMVSLLAQAVAHTSEEDDPEFWNKTEEEYQVSVHTVLQ